MFPPSLDIPLCKIIQPRANLRNIDFRIFFFIWRILWRFQTKVNVQRYAVVHLIDLLDLRYDSRSIRENPSIKKVIAEISREGDLLKECRSMIGIRKQQKALLLFTRGALYISVQN